jgi:hypothetical protein
MNLEQLHSEVLKACVRVRTKRAGGSGTVIYSQGEPGQVSTYVLTNQHVIDDAVRVVEKWDPVLQKNVKRDERDLVEVHFFNYRWSSRVVGANAIEAEIVAYDKDEDLALLKLRGTDPVPAVAKMFPRGEESRLLVGEPIITVGCGLGEPPVLTQGVISVFGREIDSKEYWLCTAPSIYGNCLPATARVATQRGSVPIAEVRPGDKVFAPTAGGLVPTEVGRRVFSGAKPCVRITTGTRTIEASTDHPILTARLAAKVLRDGPRPGLQIWRNVWRYAWKPAGALERGDIVVVATSWPVEESKGIGIDLARFLGAFIGDGWMRYRSGEGAEVSLAVMSEEHKERYSEIMERLWGRRPTADDRGLHLYSVDAYRALEALGLGAHATEKRVPEVVWTLPRDERIAFMEGYLDTDGYVNPSGAWVFEANNEDLIRDVRDLCVGLGWRVSNVHIRKPREKTVLNRQGRAFIASRPSAIFQAYPASSKRYLPAGAYGLERLLAPGLGGERVRKVESMGVQPVYDIEVPGPHSFVADGVAVHNSGGGTFLAETREFIGVPSRVAVTGFLGSSAVTHLSYSIPITRVYDFLEKQMFRFIYDAGFTEEGEAETRKRLLEADKLHRKENPEEDK